jgi:hypothetical protein
MRLNQYANKLDHLHVQLLHAFGIFHVYLIVIGKASVSGKRPNNGGLLLRCVKRASVTFLGFYFQKMGYSHLGVKSLEAKTLLHILQCIAQFPLNAINSTSTVIETQLCSDNHNY